jgi:RNA polymerase sigma factor (sigma-70 family)
VFENPANVKVYLDLQPKALRVCAARGAREENHDKIYMDAFESTAKHHAVTCPLFDPYLFRRLRDRCRDDYAQKMREQEIFAPTPDNFEELIVAENKDVTSVEHIDLVREALQHLVHKHRSVLHFEYDEGLSMQEIAACLDLSIPVVKTNALRARRSLAAILLPKFLAWRGVLDSLLGSLRDSCLAHLQNDVDSVVEKLNPHYQEVLRLHYREGLPIAQMAAALGISESLVRLRVSCAKNRVAKLLQTLFSRPRRAS